MTEASYPSQSPVYHATGGPSSTAALDDIVETFTRSQLWIRMAWQDVRQRYRGSILGPFWLTISMGLMILAMGFVYGRLLKSSANEYFPFLTLGLMQWGFMSNLVQEACTTFIHSWPSIKQLRLPYTIYAMRTLMRCLVVYAHNFIIYILVAMIFGIWPGAHLWLLLPGYALLLINGLWVIVLLGMICARFRDITPLIVSIVQIVFFVTPVIWSPVLLQEHQWVVYLNPFYHFIELIRAPLLGQAPSFLSYAYTSLMAVIGIIVTFMMFRRYRARIAYWV